MLQEGIILTTLTISSPGSAINHEDISILAPPSWEGERFKSSQLSFCDGWTICSFFVNKKICKEWGELFPLILVERKIVGVCKVCNGWSLSTGPWGVVGLTKAKFHMVFLYNYWFESLSKEGETIQLKWQPESWGMIWERYVETICLWNQDFPLFDVGRVGLG